MASIDNNTNNNEHEWQHDEPPPFALVESSTTTSTSIPQHIFSLTSQPISSKATPINHSDSQITTTSSPPGLMESVFSSDGSTSACSSYQTRSQYDTEATSSAFNGSSSIPPMNNIATGESSYLPDSQDFGFQNSTTIGNTYALSSSANNNNDNNNIRKSVGFSQLMNEADDTNDTILRSRMPMVPEEDSGNSSSSGHTSQSLGTLIASGHASMDYGVAPGGWLPNLWAYGNRQALQSVIPTTQPAPSSLAAPLLSYSVAREPDMTGIETCLVDDNSFEVTMNLDATNYLVDDVVTLLGNPELLRLWCDPVHALVVTSSSDETSSQQSSAIREADKEREYEGQWIEATTGALASPSTSLDCVYSTARIVMSSLGFPTYGRVAMFVERRRGKVGLTIGPFVGGVSASHTITVQTLDDGATIQLVDRVRLEKYDEDDNFSMSDIFLCGVFDSIYQCFTPSLSNYAEQALSSMARLRTLLKQKNDASKM